MVNEQFLVIIHRYQSHAILKIFCQHALVYHVVVESIIQFNVYIVNQIPVNFLKKKKLEDSKHSFSQKDVRIALPYMFFQYIQQWVFPVRRHGFDTYQSGCT